MKRKRIRFQELLERLLPLGGLPPVERVRIQRALASGSPSQIEHAALVALHQLEELGEVRRLESPAENPGMLRFRARTGLDVITLELPSTIVRDGVEIHPRMALVSRARTGFDAVRQLLRLDDPFTGDPRRTDARQGLIEGLDEIGRDLFGADDLRFIPRDTENLAGDEPFDAELALQARSDARVVISVPDTAQSIRLSEAGRQHGIGSLLVAGVFGEDGEAIGHLEALAAMPLTFGVHELALLALLTDCCASVWQRSARIEKLVFIDPLTRSFNRAYFDRQVLNEMARAQRDASSFALCLADIDDFKQYNTHHGYEAGNQVLENVASTLRNAVRPFDTVARWGGEEFAVLLTAPVSGPDVATICERLRSLIERQIVPIESLDRQVHRTSVTVSIGVALFPDDAKTPQDLFRAANSALLEAKSGPKNRVVYYRPPTERRANQG